MCGMLNGDKEGTVHYWSSHDNALEKMYRKCSGLPRPSIPINLQRRASLRRISLSLQGNLELSCLSTWSLCSKYNHSHHSNAANRPACSRPVIAIASVDITRRRTGCLVCRLRRKKCDEDKPICRGCARNSLVCRWPSLENEKLTATQHPGDKLFWHLRNNRTQTDSAQH